MRCLPLKNGYSPQFSLTGGSIKCLELFQASTHQAYGIRAYILAISQICITYPPSSEGRGPVMRCQTVAD